MKKQQFRLAVLCLLLAVCSQFPAQAGTIEAINHTKWAINRFSVDGSPGIDIIGPYQGGGGGVLLSDPR
ncbi:membrane protein [Photorhabdus temperata subsp. temperata M1021]|nr:membrane protein [Photorhabdus temperata subsp. temperata M1021]